MSSFFHQKSKGLKFQPGGRGLFVGVDTCQGDDTWFLAPGSW